MMIEIGHIIGTILALVFIIPMVYFLWKAEKRHRFLNSGNPHQIFPELLEWKIGDRIRCPGLTKDNFKYMGSDGTVIITESINDDFLWKYTPSELAGFIKKKKVYNQSLRERRNRTDIEITKLKLSGNVYQEFLKIQQQHADEAYKIMIEDNRRMLSTGERNAIN